MKIVLVSYFCYPESRGGGEVYSYDLAKSFKKGSNEVKTFCGKRVSDNAFDSQERGLWEGMEVTKIVLRKSNHPFSRYSDFSNTRIAKIFGQYLRKEKPDIVHFQALRKLGASLVLEAKKLNIPTVITLHDGWWLCPLGSFLRMDNKAKCEKDSFWKCVNCLTRSEQKRFFLISFMKNIPYILFRRWYCKKTLKKVDWIIAPSYFLAKKYTDAGIPEEKIIVSHNGINTEALQGREKRTDPAKIKLGFLAGTAEFKGYNLLINALKILDKNNFSLHIWGVCEQRIVDKTFKEIQGKDIIFHSVYNRQQISEVFSQIDILLFPSLLQENCPLSILESFAAKVPVIATRIGGIPELVKNGVNGLLFEHNDATDLAKKIKMVLENPSLIEKMAESINKVKDIKEQSQEIEEIYKKLTKMK